MYVHRFYCLIKFVVYVKHVKRETSVNNSRYCMIFLRKVLGDYTKMREISLTGQLSGQERISRFKHRYCKAKLCLWLHGFNLQNGKASDSTCATRSGKDLCKQFITRYKTDG